VALIGRTPWDRRPSGDSAAAALIIVASALLVYGRHFHYPLVFDSIYWFS